VGIQTHHTSAQHLQKLIGSLCADQPCEYISYDVLSEMFKVVLTTSVAIWLGGKYLQDHHSARSNQDHFPEVIVSSHKGLLNADYTPLLVSS
jgi:hypothetical protein